MRRAVVQSSIREVIAQWRRLTSPPAQRRRGPGEPVLVGCSGGADSCALVLALAAAKAPGVVAHVVHDLRPGRQALADRDAAKRLAKRVAWPFVEARVKVKAVPRNAEANARRLRYDALAKLAARRGVRFVATAHHADDQIETVLMRLLRGAGPTKLAGIRERRPLSPRVTLIRPMLGVSRAQARAVCVDAGWKWREDATNQDGTRLRARLRAEIVPRLRRIRPDVGERVGTLAAQSTELDRLLAARVRGVLKRATREPASGAARAVQWPRAWLATRVRCEGSLAVGAALRAAIASVSLRKQERGVRAGASGSSRVGIPARTIADIMRALADHDGTARVWDLGSAHVTLDRDRLRVARQAAALRSGGHARVV